ncbi:hypothetical protein KJZ61_02455 [Candidatus Dependentiae bacterium]|nr:hypothetical protein [Candidatus Dependentiae bacterium]
MICKTILYATIVIASVVGTHHTTITCPTCLAHLKRNDKPFFIREISAQIAATQATIKTIKQEKSHKSDSNYRK